jgi:endogenous inhibitor of DNA gyrase (YacG/DUF329 family)
MTLDERITVECPRCGGTFVVWPEPAAVIDLDPELGDPGWLASHACATCPDCGKTCACAAH